MGGRLTLQRWAVCAAQQLKADELTQTILVGRGIDDDVTPWPRRTRQFEVSICVQAAFGWAVFFLWTTAVGHMYSFLRRIDLFWMLCILVAFDFH
mmetsp:Transcript_33720/g.88686  ORF Transcript_33720/g.88686 Transcript_33720/m.88686 type:complete len:95 (-) Transcript_33720:244-528(-)